MIRARPLLLAGLIIFAGIIGYSEPALAQQHVGVLAVDVLPHVTVVGDTTGGGLGAPIFRELPNGWNYRLPIWMQTDADDERLEAVGVAPDVHRYVTFIDSLQAINTSIETALDILGVGD